MSHTKDAKLSNNASCREQVSVLHEFCNLCEAPVLLLSNAHVRAAQMSAACLLEVMHIAKDITALAEHTCRPNMLRLRCNLCLHALKQATRHQLCAIHTELLSSAA